MFWHAFNIVVDCSSVCGAGIVVSPVCRGSGSGGVGITGIMCGMVCNPSVRTLMPQAGDGVSSCCGGGFIVIVMLICLGVVF